MDFKKLEGFALPEITDSFLDKKRKRTDPVADQVVTQIIESGHEEKINEVFIRLVTNASYQPELFKGLPKQVYTCVTDYFGQTCELPEWTNREMIQKGQNVFAEFGPEIFMLLNVKSLPLCYSCKKGAKVLYMTGRLSDRKGNIDPLVRRLMETAQMVVNTMSPGGLAENGEGIVTMQKVRLIHASIRYFLKHPKFNPKGWDLQELGEPINQEDLAGTLMSFSPVILSGLKQLNITLSSDQINCYTHCWKVIGYMMGLDHDLLPDSFDDSWELAVRILKHQAATSPEGKELTDSCIKFLNYMTPGTAFDEVPGYMIWYFMQDISADVGKDIGTMIGVQGNGDAKDRLVLILARIFSKVIDHSEEHHVVIRKLTEVFNKAILRGFLKHYNGEKNIHFFIPPSLQKDWKLREKWIDKAPITPNIFGNRLTWQQKSDSI